MKFFSVFVVYLCVRTAYSLYTGSPVSTNPRPEIQSSRLPVNVQNVYPSTQQNISGQPPPLQQNYRMGPGLPIPNQITTTNFQIPNTAQVNPQSYNAGVPTPVTASQHIVSNPYLKKFYRTLTPTKRYTIVHPNGEIEHTDNIHTVVARYPKYLMVKATDILSHNHQHNEKVKGTSTNSYEGSKPVVPYISQINQDYSGTKTQNSVEKSIDIQSNRNIVTSNPAAIKESAVKPNILEVNQIATSNPSINQDSHNNIVAANPVPIYRAPIPNVLATKQPSTGNNQTPLYSTVKHSTGDSNVIHSNPADSGNNKENQTIATDQIKSIKPTATSYVPAEVDKHEILPVILPEVRQRNTINNTLLATTTEESQQSDVTSKITTIEEPFALHSSNISTDKASNTIVDVGPSNDTSNENVQSADPSKIPLNTTNTSETVQGFNIGPEINNGSTIASVFNQSSTTFANGAPLTWFELSEDSVLEALKNKASNIYFLFLPPRPKRSREIRKTIFPNGTTTEEIIEIDLDRDQDAKPQETKNQTVVLS